MRRLSVKYGKPGMVLSQDVYDPYGKLVLPKHARLTGDNLSLLKRLGSGEIFVQDSRTEDVPVIPLIPSRLEGEAALQLRNLLDNAAAVINNAGPDPFINTGPIEKALYTMIKQVFPIAFGDVNTTGCFSLADYNYVHPVQVTSLSILIGRNMRFGEKELLVLGLASLLENIGYIVLPASIMNNPACLTEPEIKEVHQHPEFGYQILKEYSGLSPQISEIVYQHHEYWNGSGYPRGLSGDDISVSARILALADTYYAMTSRRPHRECYLPHEAIEFIVAFSGEFFDAEIVRLFTRMVPLYPTGVLVNLNTMESGIISNGNSGVIGRPQVRIVTDRDGNEMEAPFDINLAEEIHQNKLITEIVEY